MKSNKTHNMKSFLLTVIAFIIAFSINAQTQTDTYTSSTTWNCPVGVSSVTVECWGAGGAGGGNTSTADGAGGGGGGGYCIKVIAVDPVNNPYTVTVGAGGIAVSGANGGAGGNSWFLSNTTIIAYGGSGGTRVVGGANGVGGAGGGWAFGDNGYTGGTGGAGVDAANGIGGPGGSSAGTGANGWSGPSPWSTATASPGPVGSGIGGDGGAKNSNATPGTNPGGGGGGAGENASNGGNGASGKVSITYTIPASPPTITLVSNNPTVCEGILTVDLPYSGTTNSPNQYSIDYDDANFTDIVLDPLPASKIVLDIPVGTSAGNYTATLTVTNSSTSLTSIDYPITITIYPIPSAPTITPGGVTTFCAPGSVNLTSSASTGTYLWSTTETTQSISVNTSGDYTVAIIENGCTSPSSAITTVTVNPLPTEPTSVSATPNTICVGGSTTLSYTGGVGTTFKWYTGSCGGVLVGSGQNLSVSPGSTTTYYGLWENSCGNSACKTVTVTVNPPPTAPTSVSATVNPICTGNNTNLTYTGGLGTTFNWYTGSCGGTLIGTGNNFTVSPVSTTTYYGAWQTGTCVSSCQTVTVTVDLAIPVPGAIVGANPANENSPYTYNVSAPGASSYTWTIDASWSERAPGNGNSSYNVTTGPAGGPYDISVTATNACGTSAASVLAVSVVVAPTGGHINTQCNGCHLLHTAPGVTLTSEDGNALLCQSCHINPGVAFNMPMPNGDMSLIGSGTYSGNSHAWGVLAENAAMGAVPPTDPEMLAMLEGGTTIICSTCHEQHNSASFSPHLRADNTNDAICKDCHVERDVDPYPAGIGSHPIDVVYDDTDTRFKNSQTLIANGATMLCSTCHSVHDVDDTYAGVSDGNLLRLDNTSTLCTDCHIDMTHNGMTCKDCHDTHDPNKTNIYMIRENIGSGVIFTSRGTDVGDPAANSYADGDGIYDGICEVCHTTTAHFRNDGSALDQNHASSGGPMNGKSCMVCHPHGSAFSPSGGTCTGCHASAQPATYGRGGALQIVGVGGEFEPSPLTSIHTDIAPEDADCESCHYSATSHPTNQKQLRDVDLGDFEWLGDIDEYCLKCHDGAPPAGITFGAAVTDPDKSGYQTVAINHDCLGCHYRHGSTFVDLLQESPNYTLCRTCHDGGTGVNIDEADLPSGAGAKNTHAWGVNASSGLYQTNAPTTAEVLARLDAGNIVCSTCHDAHSSNTKLTVVDNTTDQMCKDCHSARNVGSFPAVGSHPVGVIYTAGGTYQDPAPTLATTQVGPLGGKVECSSCHLVHNATTSDGNLLRQTADETLCEDCHTLGSTTGTPVGTHNGMTCISCHTPHNSGTNIYLIRTDIGGSSVVHETSTDFGDQVGTEDGICEVCHTSTTYYLANGSGASHNLGTDCMTCHPHDQNFAPKGCTDCHNTAQPATYGRGGALQIVDVGGEFQPSPLTSIHTDVAPVDDNCKSCHYSSGSHPQDIMSLKDVDDEVVPYTVWGGDVDVYCLKCHDGTPPTGITFGAAVTDPDKSGYQTAINHDCLGCHYRHGSTFDDLLQETPNYTLCRTCHDGAPGVNIDEADLPSGAGAKNTHAWGVSASSGLYGTNTPSTPAISARLDAGNIVCSTCHDAHSSNTKLTVIDNSADLMCKDCHSNRNLGRYVDNISTNKGSHPVGLDYVPGGNYQNPAPTLASNQVGPKNGKIECSSCHSTHNATTTDGTLLRETMTSTVCKDCHTYKTHQTFDCLVCHQTHNGTNIMLIRSTVNTYSVVFNSQGTDATPVQLASKSFSDGDGTRDGICEVCHTTTAYHTGDADDGTTHYDGQKCTGCHAHNDATTSFPKPDCAACHDAIPGHTTNAHATHTVGKYTYACSTCHFNYGSGGSSEGSHPSSSVNVAFDPSGLGAGTSWNGTTCSNVYCHEQGGSTPTPTWASGSITTCNPCHGVAVSSTVYPATGTHDRHCGAVYGFSCITCHGDTPANLYIAPTHVNGTKDVNFDPNGLATRNGLDPNTPAYNTGTKTCSSIYCHSSATTSQRGGDGTYSWGGPNGPAIVYATIPAWNSGANVSCGIGPNDGSGTWCHEGPSATESAAAPNYFITAAVNGADINTNAQYPKTGSHAPNRGAHYSNSQNLSGNGWNQVQCFWCHEVDGNNTATQNKQQGTYGTSLHVDGQTYFLPRWYSNGGTMVNTITYSYEGSAAHCGAGKTCW